MPSHRLSDILPDLPDHQSSNRRRPRNPDEYDPQTASTSHGSPQPPKASSIANADAHDARPSWHHDGDTPASPAPKTGTKGGGDRSDVPDVIMAAASPSPPRRSSFLPPPSTLPQGNSSATTSKSSTSTGIRSPLSGGSPLSVGLIATGAVTAAVVTPSMSSASPQHSPATTSRSTVVTPQKGTPVDSRVAALSKSAGFKPSKTGKSPKKSSLAISTVPTDLQTLSGVESRPKQLISNNVDSPNSSERNASSTSEQTLTSAVRATREPFSMNWPRTMQTARKPPVFATKPPVMIPNMVHAKDFGIANPSVNGKGKTRRSPNASYMSMSTTPSVKRKSTADFVAKIDVPPASPAAVGVSPAANGQSPTARIPTVLPKCLSDLRTDLEALWLTNQPRIINEFGTLQRTALAVQNERDTFQQQLTVAEENAGATKAELDTAKKTIAGLEKTLQAELVNSKRVDAAVDVQKSELTANKAELISNKAEFERIQKELKTVQTQLDQSTSEMQSTKKQVQTAEKEKDALRVQLLQTTSEAQATRTKVGTLETEKRQLQAVFAEAQRRNEALEQANQQFVRERIQNRNEGEKRAENDKARHEADIKTFQSINDDLYKEIEDNQKRAEREVKVEKERIATLSTENDRLREEVARANNAIGNKTEAISQLKADHTKALQEAEAKLQFMQGELGKARSTDSQELREWKEKANKAMQATHERMLEYDKLQDEHVRLVETAKTRLDEIEKLRGACSQQEEQTRAKVADYDQLAKQHRALLTQCEALRKEIKARNKAREALDREVEARKKADEIHKAELESRNKICEVLRRDVDDRNKQIQSRNKAHEAAQKQVESLQEKVEALQKDAQAHASEYQELEGENENLQVEMSLRGKVAAPEADMAALEQRIRDEAAQKLAAEVNKLTAAKDAELTKLRAEKDAESRRLANEISKLEVQNAQLVSGSKVLGKRSRQEPQTEVDWRKYAEEVGSTFFDPEGVCIACRRRHKSSDSPVVPLYGNPSSQIEHVWTVHRSVLEKHREESKKVSKRLKRESVRAGSSTTSVL